MRTWLKFCGLCRSADYALAVGLGVDAVGLICVPESPRFVDDNELRFLGLLPRRNTQLTLVIQDAPESFVRDKIALAKPDLLQFHGSESPSFAEAFDIPYIKATRDAACFPDLAVHRNAFAWLIDDPNYDAAKHACDTARPIIIAGQITLENVRERIERNRPFGIDLSRGIELEPRQKDPGKMIDFESKVHNEISP